MGKLPFEERKYEVLIKRKAGTDGKYGVFPDKRPLSELINYGIINLNKPSGPTSHQVADYVKKILNLSKVGHSGTLDPKVTGVLPIALGRGTKVLQCLLKAGKEYVCLMHLHKEINQSKIHKCVKNFVGEIEQIPPIKSAVKRIKRKRNVYYFEIMEIEGKDVLFRIGCEAGTYIRKLCLHPKTEILSEIGPITSSNFYLNPKIIYSLDKGNIIKKKPFAVQRINSPKKLIKIKMSSGVDFIITPDHELLKSSLNGYEMIEAKKLKKNDYLVKSLEFPNIFNDYCISDLLDDKFLISQKTIKKACKQAFIKKYGSIRAMNKKLKIDRKAFLLKSKSAITIGHLKLAGVYEKLKYNIKEFKTKKGKIIKLDRLNINLFYLLGLIASDGNNTKEKDTIRNTRLKFHNNEEILIDKFLDEYKKIFPNIKISKKKINGGIFQIDTSNSLFATIAASLGVNSPQKKYDILPILNSKPTFIRAFLKGCFDGDGTCFFMKKKIGIGYYTDIRFMSVSKLFAKRIHQMLLKLKIPNKIFVNKKGIYIISLESLSSKHKFIKEVGSNHPSKRKIFIKINNLNSKGDVDDHFYVGFHYKEFIEKNRPKLFRMGGNLSRVLKENTPITRRFYKKCSNIVNLPALDDFIIEKINSIEYVCGNDYVYDLTVPRTHNFLFETGFVSSNCHDFGLKIGCGAHMVELVRTKAGPFCVNGSFSLHDLKDNYEYFKDGDNADLKSIILPIEFAVTHLKKIWINDNAVDSLAHGADLSIPGVVKLDSDIIEEDIVAVMSLKDELVCIGDAKFSSDKIMKEEKGVCVVSNKVFMERGVYPKFKKELSSQSSEK